MPNSLYEMARSRRPTVDNAVRNMFGMQPGMDRLNLLPRYDRRQGWIAPNALYQIARALVAPGVAAQGGDVSAEDAMNFAGNVSLGGIGASAMMRNPAPGPGRTLPMTVYHGSPHSFDRFDMSKVGTGEGAQAYGHGLYVAESPDVAKRYQTTLAPGRRVNDLNSRMALVKVGGRPATEYNVDNMDELIDAARQGPDAAQQFMAQRIESWKRNAADESYPFRDYARQKIAAYEQMQADVAAKGIKYTGDGALYTVDLPDEHIAQMLDWDKPLSEQPHAIRAMQKAGLGDAEGLFTVDGHVPYNNITGGDAYQQVMWQANQMEDTPWAKGFNNPAAAASSHLNSFGIPGIKYFDGSSRAAGEGTRNFVVFDDKLLKILGKE